MRIVYVCVCVCLFVFVVCPVSLCVCVEREKEYRGFTFLFFRMPVSKMPRLKLLTGSKKTSLKSLVLSVTVSKVGDKKESLEEGNRKCYISLPTYLDKSH